jgi:hypothetical protein
MEYNFKYAYKGTCGQGERGRSVDPDSWCTGPDRLTHDKYYSWLKHRSQAKYRKEDYSLTWEQWSGIWQDDLWHNRGRGIDNLCLQQIDRELGWHIDNVEVISRREHLKSKQGKELPRAK